MTPLVQYSHDEFIVESEPDSYQTIQPKVRAPVVVSKNERVIRDALVNHIEHIDHEICEAGDEDSFFVADLGQIYRSARLWQETLPNVHAHYAVKCNTDPKVIKLLGELDINFDCASKNEIDTVLNLGFTADRIVYANPCKTNSFIRHANGCGVNLTTVDNCQELRKLKQFHPECGILIRIATDDETATCRLSTKFGCTVDTAINELLPLGKELDLNIKGIAFHVGSGAKDFSSIYKAVEDARTIFNAAINNYGFDMCVVDIGGGFETHSFLESSEVVKFSLDKFFPTPFANKHNIRFIAEPGRFMVSNAFTLAAHIIARRDLSAQVKQLNDIEAMIYINDGVYGNLNCILFDHYQPTPHVLKHEGNYYYGVQNQVQTKDFSIWGPTCDGLDCVSSRSSLCADVKVGDWLYFSNLGAYTSAATTSFNGFKGVANTIYVCSEEIN